MIFHTPELQERDAVLAAAEAAGAAENDASFVNLYLLREKYGTEIAFAEDMLLRRYRAGFRAGCYGFPLGSGDLKKALQILRDDAAEAGQPFRLTLLTKTQCEALEAAEPGRFSCTPLPD